MRITTAAFFAALALVVTVPQVFAGEHRNTQDRNHPTTANHDVNPHHPGEPCHAQGHAILQRIHHAVHGHSDDHAPEGNSHNSAPRDVPHASHDQVALNDMNNYLRRHFEGQASVHGPFNGTSSSAKWEIRWHEIDHDGEHFTLYHATNLHDLKVRYTLLSAGHGRCLDTWLLVP